MSRRGRRQEGRPEGSSSSPSFHRGGGSGGGKGRSGVVSSESHPSLSSAPVPSGTFPVPISSSVVSRPSSSALSISTATITAGVGSLTVQSVEPETVNDPAVNMPPASKNLVTMPSRPGFGKAGQKCVIRTNHFLVEVGQKDLHHYDVTISPEVTSKQVNREVISELIRSYKVSHLGQRTPAYDGRKSLYTAGALPFTSKEFVVKLVDNDRLAGSARREREFKVAIKFAAKADLHHLQQFINGRQRDSPHETIQVLDVVLRETPSLKYTFVGQSFFSPDLGATGPLGDGLEYWRGFYQSLRPTQMGLSLNIDVSARAFYEPIPVTEFVAKFFNVRELTRPLTDRDRVKLFKALKGLKVEPIHTGRIRRYRVTGLSVQPADQLMFTDDEGNMKSVARYFGEKYDIKLNLPFLPCIQSGNAARPVYLPMEVCRIAKGQRYSKKLNDRQVTAMLKATCQRPHDRESSVKQMVRRNNYNDKNGLVNKEFGINIKEDLTVVNARVLPPPKLRYHETGKESSVDPRAGQWNMVNKKMDNGGTVDYWTCISFSKRMPQDTVQQFCEELVSMCSSKGMNFNQDPLISVHSSHAGQIEKALRDVHSQSVAKLASIGQSDKRLKLLIIILPDVTGSYGRIKKVCETELGIVSQCCQPNQAQRLRKQYLENLSLKINVKVGGRNTVLVDATNGRIPPVTDVPTIIFGADVTHPQPGEDSSSSIAAVVASMDWPEVTKYRAVVSAQHHRTEIIEDLYKMIRDHFIAFRNSTRLKPARVIFYRDGVSEGQFSQVLLEEMDSLRKALDSLEVGYQPKVTFIVVQKRHRTRFFTDDLNQMDRSDNILPGTVVDSKICHPTKFDFYLNSHAGIQGTSRPSHYHVLLDENNFGADALQTLTNNLCYTYARCTRSVSIVPPAYYAHLAAFRARCYVEGNEASDSHSTSSAGGRNTREMTAEVRPLPDIKKNVQEVMYFC